MQGLQLVPHVGYVLEQLQRLLGVLDRLVTAGNTVLVIEHNLDVIKTADWIIDLGPEGGDEGGRVVAAGTPEQIAATNGSATGEYLARILRGEPLVPLSDVTFSDEAGRPGISAKPALPLPEMVPARKRVAAARSAGER